MKWDVAQPPHPFTFDRDGLRSVFDSLINSRRKKTNPTAARLSNFQFKKPQPSRTTRTSSSSLVLMAGMVGSLVSTRPANHEWNVE